MAVTLTNEVTVCDSERVCWAIKHARGQRAALPHPPHPHRDNRGDLRKSAAEHVLLSSRVQDEHLKQGGARSAAQKS